MTDETSDDRFSAIELRVLGALMEKARTTPDIYPLTLNALVTACNQKTSRDPVTDHDEDEILHTLDDLREKGLVMRVDMAGSRVAKFREQLSAQWKLNSQEYALLAVLFLRGPQTPGQLRARTERLYGFAEVQQVQEWLHRMQDREEEPFCLVGALPRLPGTKEVRYGHVFGEDLPPGEVEPSAEEDEAPAPRQTVEMKSTPLETRLTALEERVAILENLIDDLTS